LSDVLSDPLRELLRRVYQDLPAVKVVQRFHWKRYLCVLEGAADELTQVSAERTLDACTAVRFFLMLGERPSTASGQRSSQQSKTNHAAICTDQDSYQIYTTLLKDEKKHLYVIQAEIDGHPDLTSKNLGIEGDKEFMREWEPVMDDYAEQNHTAKLLQRTFSLRTSYELVPASSILNGQKLGRLLPAIPSVRWLLLVFCGRF
jgi:hypothetical protein